MMLCYAISYMYRKISVRCVDKDFYVWVGTICLYLKIPNKKI